MLVIAHVGSLLGAWFAARGINFLFGLNAIIAIAVLIYAASRTRYILAAHDWSYLGLVVFEALVLTGAILAFRDNQIARICSYVAFGLHAIASIAAVVFAFTFKLTKLM